MRLLSLEVEHYRNIATASLCPGRELTVICGNNGQGKTNLLEAIWLLTGGKSFRGGKDTELIQKEQSFALLHAKTEQGEGKVNEVRLTIGGQGSPRQGRYASLNGQPTKRASTLAGSFPAVVFDPGHLSLVKGTPEGRRKFIDAALCQLYPGYLSIYRRYLRVLQQKNALLRKGGTTATMPWQEKEQTLDILDVELAIQGEALQARRRGYLEAFVPLAIRDYHALSRGAESLSVRYAAMFEQGGLLELLKQNRQTELRAGVSLYGPHREDIEFFLNGQSAKAYASQGQQRSIVLSLKMAEAATAAQITGEHPVLLLDDVLSELDESRKSYLLTRIQEKQTFVTSCDDSAFLRTEGEVYQMENGRLIRK